MKNKLLFIINPISGVGRQKIVENAILKNLDLNKFEYQVEYTQYAGHATEIAKNAISKYDIVVAVGGDGSVNETAKSLINSNVTLAIIPTGSGNGLARHLKIPLKIDDAINQINKFNVEQIDVLKINDEFSFNVSGIGFDALISHKFASFGKRGFWSYLKIVIKEFSKYKPVDYNLKFDEIDVTKTAFLLSLANSSQFGNNAWISPKSIINDGKFEIVILKKFSLIHAISLAVKLFRGTIHNSKYVETISVEKLEIKNQEKLFAHIDGDPFTFESDINISVLHKTLNILV